MLQNFILIDIIQYVLNIYISHRPDDLEVLEKMISLKFNNTDKYTEIRRLYNIVKFSEIEDDESFEIYIDDELYFRELANSQKPYQWIAKDHKYFRNKLYDGICKSWYNTGELFSISKYEKGKIFLETNYDRIVFRKEYHYRENGKIEKIIIFDKGNNIFSMTQYNRKGQKKI
jgi:hypothetical protein